MELRYPAELPITARRDELLDVLGHHQVVIVAGETGSGKSTQLPKLLLEAGRGVHGLIGHTQPRRVAARTIAERVADELGTTIGGTVGFTVRFNDRVGDDTVIRVMTDGILLAELPRDRMLRALRRPDHRRGARAQPQHRLHPRLSAPTAPPAARPAGGRHVGHHRHRALRPPLRPRRRRRPDRRDHRAHLPRRDALPARAPTTATRCRPSSTPSASSGAREAATCWCSCPASGRSATPPTRSLGWNGPVSRCCRCTPGCRRPSSTGSSSPTRRGGWC